MGSKIYVGHTSLIRQVSLNSKVAVVSCRSPRLKRLDAVLRCIGQL